MTENTTPLQLANFSASGYVLEALQLFQNASPQIVAPLLADCPVLRLPRGTRLDDRARNARLHVVLSGCLEAISEAQRNAPQRGSGQRVMPGECVGEVAVLDQGAESDTLVALQETDVLVIDAERVWRLVEESNCVARNLLRLLSFRIRAANAQLRRRQQVSEFYRLLSMADGLTGLQNRAWLNEHLPLLVGQAHDTGTPLSVIMIDLDHFKRFNDEHGHIAGDRALQIATRTIAGALRPSDHAARYGGEELIVILPDTGLSAASVVARRLCDQIRQSPVFDDGRPLPHITASLGVAALERGQEMQSLIATADAALYRAKQAGRDGVA